MNILGISSYYHDSAACLVMDGVLRAAVQEERFNRIKNTSDFPMHAINYCVQAGGISFLDLDYIGIYEKPYLKFYRVVLSHLRAYPFSLPLFMNSIPQWLQDRLVIPQILKKEIGFAGKVLFIKHHMSHAASTFLVSPFEEAAIITSDGVGEWATATYGIGRGNEIDIMKEILFPHSLGLLYTAVTTHLGYKAHEGEGKVMGLAGHGKPRYIDKFHEIIDLADDGSFHFNTKYLDIMKGRRMYSRRFVRLFGQARKPDEKLDERHCDIAASLQLFVEEALLKMARHVHEVTKLDNLCLAGGTFLNCVANNRILEETPFSNVFVQAAAGDGGGSIGVAMYIYNRLLKHPRVFTMEDAYLGPSFDDEEIRIAIQFNSLNFSRLEDDELFPEAARMVKSCRVVGWFQGRMEIGPRALGNRSILGNPCDASMKDIINSKVKHREPFRPFAPAVLEEKANEYFDMAQPSPFMLLSPRVREDKKNVIPAVTHIDGSARVQTVSRKTNPRLWRLIKEFENLSGVPIVINTSFNRQGEPIVCTPQDAINCYLQSEMDCLIMGNYILQKGS